MGYDLSILSVSGVFLIHRRSLFELVTVAGYALRTAPKSLRSLIMGTC